MAENSLTPSQKKAIDERGKNMLVSASAGSGKTFVMIERVKKLIIEGEASVSNILAVTYTKLAADEMKQKLIKAIIGEINAGNNSERFRRELKLIPSASVSTFHSFCNNLLKTYFYLIGLDASFNIADETDGKTLAAKAMDRLFEEKYEKKDEDFLYLVKVFFHRRNDAQLKELVKNLYDFSISEKDPSAFLDSCANKYSEENFDFISVKLAETYKNSLFAAREEFCELYEKCETFGYGKYCAYLKTFISDTDILLSGNNVYETANCGALFSARLPAVKNTDGDDTLSEIKQEIQDTAKSVKDFYKNLTDSLSDGREKMLDDFLRVKKLCLALVNLTKEYSEYYTSEKREENVVDFSDLEHLTYKLLTENPEITGDLKEKYKYIFADEYQDVNNIQEAILSLIGNGNLFMVGDVKQSIYAFRGCNPDIFSAKYKRFEAGEGSAIPLGCNFRSSDGVLNAVNNIFSAIMTEDFGGVDYASRKMEGGGLYPQNIGGAVTHVIEKEKKEKTAPDPKVYSVEEAMGEQEKSDEFYEGLEIGKIISEEIGKPFYDIKTKEYRSVSFGDVAVLTRNSTGFTNLVVKELIRLGIPVSSEAKNSIGEYSEVKLMINILELIDRSDRDVPLAAALTCKMGGLNDSDIADIRAFAPKTREDGKTKTTFSFSVDYYRKNGDNLELKEKLDKFFSYTDRIRLLSEFDGAGKTLERILGETGLDLEILSENMGAEKMKRIRRLIGEAEAGGKSVTVHDFLLKLEANIDNIAVSEVSGDNNVKVMSIHSSKGLEFPIVIVAGLGRKFNNSDIKQEDLTDRNYGLALKYYDIENMKVSETLQRMFFKEIKKKQLIKEEERIFYVAVTRAQYKLHLVISGDIAKKHIKRKLYSANNYSDFLAETDMETEKISESELISLFSPKEKNRIFVGAGNKSLTEKIYSYLSYNYPFKEETFLPVKRSVSAVVKSDEEQFYERTDLFGFSDAEKGTAYHKFLEKCSFNADSVESQLTFMKNEKILSEEHFKAIDSEKLKTILSLPIFEELQSWKVYREQPFIMNFPAKEVIDGANSSEPVLIQGVLDLIAVKDGKAVIIDYKLSTLKNGEDLIARYTRQLNLYKRAAEKILNVKCEKLLLINILSAKIYEIC